VWVLRRNEERLQARALTDSLTNLPNPSLFVDRVDRALTQADRESGSFAVLLVDLDDFEETNHALGHEVGDRPLRETAPERRGVGVPARASCRATLAGSK
jgi:diguanylate cyclase (GGDEF)-like protein